MEHSTHEPTAALPAPSEVEGPVLTDETLNQLIDALRSDPKALATFVERATPDNGRTDGWTPFCRRLFLEVLAETGRVSRACEYAQLTKQSAYALRARDPLFAASWDAACELARAPLADALYERALDGVTDTITRDGEVVAERHRHDNRLSIAVLHRLDKRCDRAVESGANHLPILRHWDEWMKLVGRGEEQAAQALLDAARAQTLQHGQIGQLPLGENPTEEEKEPEEIDLSDRCWKDEDGVWMTSFPPPPGFDGYRVGDWRDYKYERACTDQEAAILEADEADAIAVELTDEETLRDAWFKMLAEGDEPEAAETPDVSCDFDAVPADPPNPC